MQKLHLHKTYILKFPIGNLVLVPTLAKYYFFKNRKIKNIPSQVYSPKKAIFTRKKSFSKEKRVLFLTEYCNLNCVYCYEGEKRQNYMSDNLIKNIINDLFLQAHKKKLSQVSLSLFGGEPTLNFKKIYLIIYLSDKLSKKYNIKCNRSIVTNCLLNKNKTDYLINKFDNIFISLDGPFNINSLQRKSLNNEKTYNQIFNNAKKIYDQAFDKLQFKITITSKTINKLEEIMKFFNSEFPLVPQLYQPCMVGKDNELHIDFNEFLKKFALAKNKNPLKKLITNSLFKHFPSDVFCNLSNRRVVTPTGDVFGCHRLNLENQNDVVKNNFKIGYYENNKLIINKEKVNKIKTININKSLASSCGDCFARFHCAGGCAAIKLHNDLSPYKGKIQYCKGIRWFTVDMILDELGVKIKNKFKKFDTIKEHNNIKTKESQLDKISDYTYDLLERS
ncbi:MAG: radical SAM protein [Halanaerobiales bacterium]|nr:radical SAM protein [Halanaerobiales bacterium]